jgi:hypothetical protein
MKQQPRKRAARYSLQLSRTEIQAFTTIKSMRCALAGASHIAYADLALVGPMTTRKFRGRTYMTQVCRMPSVI